MVVDRTISVGFHSSFGTFKSSRRPKTPSRLAITNEFPFNPTFGCKCKDNSSATIQEMVGPPYIPLAYCASPIGDDVRSCPAAAYVPGR